MLRFPVKGRTLAQLRQMSEPSPQPGGVSEAVPWVFYDTLEYVDNTTTNLTFFQAAPANRNVSNLSPPGSLPEPQYFEVYGFMLDFLEAASTTTQWADVSQLLWGPTGNGGPIFTFTLADKAYGPWPLTVLHGTGGITGFGLGPAAAAVEEYANNSIPDGGFYTDGAIVIPPSQNFSAAIQWQAAEDISANFTIRLSMAGVLHRRVL